MLKWFGRLFTAAVLFGTLTTESVAGHRHLAAHLAGTPAKNIATIDAVAPPAHAARVGEITRVPYGWADFCTRRAEECRVDVLEPVDLVLSARVMRILADINTEANATIEPVSNIEHWGTLLDHWDYFFYVKGYC